MWNLEVKTNGQTNQKQTHSSREQISGCQMAGELEGQMKMMKGIKYKWPFMKTVTRM